MRPKGRTSSVNCRHCSHENPESARYCNSCGGALHSSGSAVAVADVPGIAPSLDAPRIGHVVEDAMGRYRLVREVGRGAFGVVFEASHLESGEAVAIKFLNVFLMVSGAEGASMRSRFAREWTAGSKLDHPNICRMRHTGEAGGVPYIVMDLAPGETLSQRLSRGPMPLEDGIAVVGGILSALHHSHTMGVIHRDIKPSNIVVAPSGRALLMDFGIAKVMETFSGSLMTQTGLFGTPSYMSPEQASGGRIDHRSDLFSVGLVAYEVFTGRRAFEGHPAAIISQILSKPLPPAPELPRALQEWLERACVRDAAGRFPSAREMGEALGRVAGRLHELASLETVAAPAGALQKIEPATSEPARVRTVVVVDVPPLGPPLRRAGRTAMVVFLVACVLPASAFVGWQVMQRRAAVRAHALPPAPPLLDERTHKRVARDIALAHADAARVVRLKARLLEEQGKGDEARALLQAERDALVARMKVEHGPVPPGLSGFRPDQIEIVTIDVGSAVEKPRATVLGPDGLTYEVHVGDPVGSFVIAAIDGDEVRLVSPSDENQTIVLQTETGEPPDQP